MIVTKNKMKATAADAVFLCQQPSPQGMFGQQSSVLVGNVFPLCFVLENESHWRCWGLFMRKNTGILATVVYW